MSIKSKIAAALLLFLYLLPLWLHPLFPSQDGPSHLYNTVVFTELLWNPKGFFSLFCEINARPFPNWMFTALASVLHPLLPIVMVEKIILSLYLVGLVLAGFYFVRSIDAEKTPLGFGFVLFGYNWFLLMGFYNFCLSIPLALFAIGYGLRHRGVLHPLRLLGLSLVFLLLYFCHLVSFGVAVLALGIAFGLFGQQRRHALGQLAITLVPAGLCFGLHYLGKPGARAPTYWLPIELHAANTFSLKLGPLFHKAEWIWFVALWATLGFCALRSLQTLRGARPEQRTTWCFVAAAVALCWFVPYNLFGGTALNDRFAIYIGLFLLGALSWKAVEARKTLLCGAFVVLVSVQLVYLHVCFHRWNRPLESFVRAAEHIDPRVRVLPLVFETNEAGFYVNPLLHADSYALLKKHCATPTNYEAYLDYFPVVYKKDAPMPGPATWYEPRAFLQRDMARHYEFVLLWNAPADIIGHPALASFREVHAGNNLRVLKHP